MQDYTPQLFTAPPSVNYLFFRESCLSIYSHNYIWRTTMEKNLRIGSLCTGYGGLDVAALAVFGGSLAWCADNDRHVATILRAHYPDVPNLGDVTALDWHTVPTVDILCAGFPCQDISYSGKGLGIGKGVRSGIWKNIVQGIRIVRPTVIVVENVAAIRSRGLGRVLGDMATLGYDASWTSVRAGDIGAAHRRERVFMLAYKHSDEANDMLTAAYTRGQRWQRRTTDSQTPSWQPSGGSIRPGDLAVAAPTKQTSISSSGDIAWGKYEAAIRRWEGVTERPAPYPIEPGTRGQPRLAAVFSEWLMALPKGFVTDLGLPYSAQHRVLGNGVVPQQAVAALWQLVAMVQETAQQQDKGPVLGWPQEPEL